jgi:hypothetical protein
LVITTATSLLFCRGHILTSQPNAAAVLQPARMCIIGTAQHTAVQGRMVQHMESHDCALQCGSIIGCTKHCREESAAVRMVQQSRLMLGRTDFKAPVPARESYDSQLAQTTTTQWLLP